MEFYQASVMVLQALKTWEGLRAGGPWLGSSVCQDRGGSSPTGNQSGARAAADALTPAALAAAELGVPGGAARP